MKLSFVTVGIVSLFGIGDSNTLVTANDAHSQMVRKDTIKSPKTHKATKAPSIKVRTLPLPTPSPSPFPTYKPSPAPSMTKDPTTAQSVYYRNLLRVSPLATHHRQKGEEE